MVQTCIQAQRHIKVDYSFVITHNGFVTIVTVCVLQKDQVFVPATDLSASFLMKAVNVT